MTRFLTAPSERPPIETLGPKSPLPESVGADITWDCPEGLCGAQRKEQMDLIASVRDGRLIQELEQMQSSLRHRFLIIEGQPQWNADGTLMSQHTRWTLSQQRGIEFSSQLYGVLVTHTRNAKETCGCVEYLYDWTQRPHDTSSLLVRGSSKSNGWGRIDHRSTAIALYSFVPAVSLERAQRIYDAGIRLLVCGTTVEELMAVPSIGKPTAEKIIRSIATSEGSQES